MCGASRFQSLERRIKWQPLRDADSQLALALQLLKGLEVVPVSFAVFGIGVVLHRRDAGLRNLLQRSLDCLTPLVRRGRRNDCGDQIPSGLAKYPVGLSTN